MWVVACTRFFLDVMRLRKKVKKHSVMFRRKEGVIFQWPAAVHVELIDSERRRERRRRWWWRRRRRLARVTSTLSITVGLLRGPHADLAVTRANNRCTRRTDLPILYSGWLLFEKIHYNWRHMFDTISVACRFEILPIGRCIDAMILSSFYFIEGDTHNSNFWLLFYLLARQFIF